MIIIRSNPFYIFTTHSGTDNGTTNVTHEIVDKRADGSDDIKKRYDMGWYDVMYDDCWSLWIGCG